SFFTQVNLGSAPESLYGPSAMINATAPSTPSATSEAISLNSASMFLSGDPSQCSCCSLHSDCLSETALDFQRGPRGEKLSIEPVRSHRIAFTADGDSPNKSSCLTRGLSCWQFLEFRCIGAFHLISAVTMSWAATREVRNYKNSRGCAARYPFCLPRP